MKIASQKTSTKKVILVLSAILLVVLLGYTAVASINSFWPFQNNEASNANKTPKTNNTETNQKNNQDNNSSTTGSIVSSPDENSDGSVTASPSATPNQPSGVFVSNHRPNISGKPYPSQINSTCTTTPGTTCVITFTKNGETKSLTPQKTDANGNTSWNWDIKDIGLTAGTWKIKAIASNGDLSSETLDPIEMVISD